MKVSQQVLEWQAEAKVELMQAHVLRLLEINCRDPLPADLVRTIQGMTDLDELSRWSEAALSSKSIKKFRAAVQQ